MISIKQKNKSKDRVSLALSDVQASVVYRHQKTIDKFF